MHFLPDDQDPYGIVRTLVDALPSGSHLVLSHAASDLYFRDTARPEPESSGIYAAVARIP